MPSAPRTGMFCRLGLLEESRPVAVAAAVAIREPWQGLKVGGTHLFQLAEAQDGVNDGMACQAFQGFLTCGRLAVARLAGHGQPEFRIEDLAKLLGRAQVEAFSGLVVDFLGQHAQFLAHLAKEVLEGQHVDTDACILHAGQHGRERQLQIVVEIGEAVAHKAGSAPCLHGQGHKSRSLAVYVIGQACLSHQPGPGIVAFLGIEEVGGKAQIIEPAPSAAQQGRFLPGTASLEQGLGIAHHQQGGRLAPVYKVCHGAGPQKFPALCSVRCGQAHSAGAVRSVRPDDGHTLSRAGGQRFHSGDFFEPLGVRAPGKVQQGGTHGGLEQIGLVSFEGRLGRACSRPRGKLRGCACGRTGTLLRCGEGHALALGRFPAKGHDFAHQGPHLEFLGQSQGLVHVDRSRFQIVQGDVRALFGGERGQLSVDKHLLEMTFELFLMLGGEEAEAVADVFQAGEVPEDLQGRLGTNARHARDVVHGIAGQGLQVRPKGDGNTGLFLHALHGDNLFVLGGRIPHDDIGPQALLQILVRRDNDHGVLR